jgi:hypothetical protein
MTELPANSSITKAILDWELNNFQRRKNMMEIHQSIVALEEMDQPLQDIIAMASHNDDNDEPEYPVSVRETIESSDPIGALFAIRTKIKKIADNLKKLKCREN